MSIIRCPSCEENIDTDFEDTDYIDYDGDMVEACQNCIDGKAEGLTDPERNPSIRS